MTRGLSISLVLALLSGTAAGQQSEPNATSDQVVPSAPLTLELLLTRYMGADATWRSAQTEAALAAVETARSRDRTTVNLELAPDAGFVGSGYGTGASTVSITREDTSGGTLAAQALGETYAQLGSEGAHAGVGVEYGVPLLRNRMGRLYDLETNWHQMEQAAALTAADAYRWDSCLDGADLFLALYYLQEQLAIWEELLAHKEQTYNQAQAQFNRRLLPKLDYLAARSDWLSAQQRGRELEGQHQIWRATLATYLGEDGRDSTLAPPPEAITGVAMPDDLGSTLETHPTVAAHDLWLEAYATQKDWVGASVGPEITLIPGAGVDVYTDAVGVEPPLQVGANLRLSVDLPLVTPNRTYDEAALGELANGTRLDRTEAIRALGEAARVAEQRIASASARRAITQDKLDIIQDQIAEAGSRFQVGQLQFQDYLQHWQTFEAARFEQLDLDYELWSAQVDLMGAVGPLPVACTVGD